MLTWFAVQTNPRCEKRAEAGLKERGFDVFLPVETRLRRDRTNKRHRVDSPLFVGYLFVGLNPGKSLYDVRLQDGVRGIVCDGAGRPRQIGHVMIGGKPVHIVNWLRSRQAMGEFDYTPARKSVYAKGGRAKLTKGMFKGSEGTMTDADERGRVWVELEGIFAGGLWVDDDHLEPVAKAA